MPKPKPPARPYRTKSTNVVWRSGKFLVAFREGILERRVDGLRLHDSAFYDRANPTVALEPGKLGHHEFSPAHQAFIDDFMLAEVRVEKEEASHGH